MNLPDSQPILRTENLVKVYGRGPDKVTAVSGVNFSVFPGEIISLVGQSGSGKSTLARMLLQLEEPTRGDVYFKGKPARPGKAYWKHVQAIFQDPFSSFNQFFTVKHQLRQAVKISGKIWSPSEWQKGYEKALEAVHLDPARLEEKYPFELSGGQMQRLLIARIFLIEPDVVIADEPTSMVDACSRGSILKYLINLQKTKGTTLVFITHDLGLAYHISHRISIMNRGKIVEQGNPETILSEPEDVYTAQLLEDIPTLDKEWLNTRPR